jgi:hypothetical protein
VAHTVQGVRGRVGRHPKRGAAPQRGWHAARQRQASARQQANREQSRIKGKVSRRANELRWLVKARLIRAGLPDEAAHRAGLMAERAYKEASGAFPGGVAYPPIGWL